MAQNNILVLAFASRIFSVAAALVVALAVTPTVFGIYGRIQVIGLAFSVVAFLRYERVIVAAQSVWDALRATRVCLRLLLATAPPCALFAVLAVSNTGERAHAALVAGLIAVAFAGRGLVLLTHSWLLRAGRQRDISRLIARQAAVQCAAQLALIGLGADAVAALLAGEIAGSAAASFRAHQLDRRVLRHGLAARPMTPMLRRWRDLPLFNMPAAFMSQALLSLPLLNWGRLADADSTGNLALAMRIADAPMQLIAATATSLAVSARMWSPASGVDRSRQAGLYVAAVAAAAAALVASAWLASQLWPSARLIDTAALVPLATIIAAATALGAPHADLVAFAGRERIALTIHALALGAGCAVAFATVDPAAMLAGLAIVLAARSAALWSALLLTETRPA